MQWINHMTKTKIYYHIIKFARWQHPAMERWTRFELEMRAPGDVLLHIFQNHHFFGLVQPV